MSPKILCLDQKLAEQIELSRAPGQSLPIHLVVDPTALYDKVRLAEYQAIIGATSADGSALAELLQAREVMDSLPDGVAIVDKENTIVWANHQFRSWADGLGAVEGKSFYRALGNAEIKGPDYSPFNTVRRTKETVCSSMVVDGSRHFQFRSSVIRDHQQNADYLIVTVRDATNETCQREKLDQIRRAGQQLADLKPTDLANMTVQDRVELLKSNILACTKDVLSYDVVEIRLLDTKTNRLEPLLSVGIEEEAAKRVLFATTSGNGVTGFVVASQKSYLCEDTTRDPLYLNGLKGARSSLTVPLMLHDEVIGSFNVESPDVGAFDASDLQFVEQFSRDLAAALNTLELLVAQQSSTARQSVQAIHAAVALPIDEILNDTVHVMEQYIGHDHSVVDRLKAIIQRARAIKGVITQIGKEMASTQAVLSEDEFTPRPLMLAKRVLVIDNDQVVRDDAHRLLERYGCIVETARRGEEAVLMVRNCGEGYDAIITDIKLPDFSGHQLMLRLKEFLENPPIILMTGYGYDPGHSIVKARQEGLPAWAILYKPFKVDNLIETVERIFTEHRVGACK